MKVNNGKYEVRSYTVKPLVQSPLNDNNFVKFMKGRTGQGVKILVTIFTKNEWKYLCY